MWAGTAALKNIDETLQSIRNDVVRLDSQLTQLTGVLGEGERHRVKLINDIARVRLADIEDGDLQTTLTAADVEAMELLKVRDAEFSALESEITALNTSITSAEAERESLLQSVSGASQKIVDLEASIQAKLAADEKYLACFEAAKAADTVAEEADRKVERAQQDMSKKALPYQKDTLFMYLWNRGFGTTQYEGNLFSRWIDGWVAKLIGYEAARVNYWNLTEIPQRLDEHADRVSAQADEARMALQQLELDALESSGVKTLESDLSDMRTKLDEQDDALEALEAELHQKLQQRGEYVSGDDESMQRCLSRLTAALNHQNLDEIYRYVRATSSPTDDKLVLELQQLDDELDVQREDLGDVRRLHDKKVNKLQELEGVRRNFKNARFDDVRSGFGNSNLINSVLGQFVEGMITGSELWRVFQRNQYYRDVGSLPGFGSGGLGSITDILLDAASDAIIQTGRRQRRRRDSTWHFPSPRRGGGGFRFPSGGRGGMGGRGGFRTGGGF